MFNSLFSEEEIEKERQVILEESQGRQDDAGCAFYDAIGDKFFVPEKGHKTIGTDKTIKSINRDKIIKYLDKNYSCENIIFIVCGPHKPRVIFEYIKSVLPCDYRHTKKNICDDNLWHPRLLQRSGKIKFRYKRENIVQSSINMPLVGVNSDDDLFVAQKVLFSAIGGGMYSVLFSKIRDELALCYSVGTLIHHMSYPNVILPMIYGACMPKNVNLFITQCEKEIAKIKHNGLSEKYFQCAKIDLLSGLYRQLETSNGIANRMVKPLLFDQQTHYDDTIKKIKKVKISDCNEVAQKVFNQTYNWAVMLPK